MSKPHYKPIVKYNYARRLKSVKPDRTQYFRLHGKRVKTYVSPDGRTLEILEAPKGLIPNPKKYKLTPQDGTLRPIPLEPEPKSSPKPIPKPIPEPPKPQPQPEPEKKEEVKEEPKA